MCHAPSCASPRRLAAASHRRRHLADAIAFTGGLSSKLFTTAIPRGAFLGKRCGRCLLCGVLGREGREAHKAENPTEPENPSRPGPATPTPRSFAPITNLKTRWLLVYLGFCEMPNLNP